MINNKKSGIIQKYHIQKTNGNPIDPNADYFVLRLDKDPHARTALEAYAHSVRTENELLANELLAKLSNYSKYQKKKHPEDEIREFVYTTIEDKLGIDRYKIKDNSILASNLAMDSLDNIELIMALETRFDINIDDSEIKDIKTIKDIVESLYIRTN